jgi:hypothetical protein
VAEEELGTLELEHSVALESIPRRGCGRAVLEGRNRKPSGIVQRGILKDDLNAAPRADGGTDRGDGTPQPNNAPRQ